MYIMEMIHFGKTPIRIVKVMNGGIAQTRQMLHDRIPNGIIFHEVQIFKTLLQRYKISKREIKQNFASITINQNSCMKKKSLLICNNSLLLLLPIDLASGILLECLHGKPFCGVNHATWVWLHIILSLALLLLVIWHIRLNWNHVGNWYQRYRKHHAKGFKLTIITFLFTIATGIVTAPIWIFHGHAGIGGVHGKIGHVDILHGDFALKIDGWTK